MVDEEQQELTDLAMRRARRLIEEYRGALEEIATELLAHEVLERETIVRIMEPHRKPGATVAELPGSAHGAQIAAAEPFEP
jgi:ATP-dependent Zn protease